MAGFGQPTAVDVQPTAVDCQPTTVTRRPALCCGPSVSEPGTFFCFLALRTALIRPQHIHPQHPTPHGDV